MPDTYAVFTLTTKRDGVVYWLDRTGAAWTRDPGAAIEYAERADARAQRIALLTHAILFDNGPRFDGLPDLPIFIATRQKTLSDEVSDIL